MATASDLTNSSRLADKKDTVIQKVRDDFIFCSEKYFAVLIFGSHARGDENTYSDIDVCIVLQDCRDYGTLLYDDIYPEVRMDQYDVVIFEGCNRNIKSDIAGNHIIVYCRNDDELNEYLRPYQEYSPVPENPKEILNRLRSVVDAI
ncbi:hypothetical protein MKMG_02206 [Methanogenium sp. MK-MG]|nr:hypothetical protein MKMG_02206 [Methanogenium sp. MK-MG]